MFVRWGNHQKHGCKPEMLNVSSEKKEMTRMILMSSNYTVCRGVKTVMRQRTSTKKILGFNKAEFLV